MKHPVACVLLAWAAITLFWCSWLIGREGPPPRKRAAWHKTPRRSRLLAAWRFITLPRFSDAVAFWVCLVALVVALTIGAWMDWAATNNGWE